MDVKKNEKDIEIIFKPNERESIIDVGKKISALSEFEKNLIDESLKNNLIYAKNRYHDNVLSGISILTDQEIALFIVNILVNSKNIQKVLTKLKNDNVINEKCEKFLLMLSAKYSGLVRESYERDEMSEDLVASKSYTIIEDKTPKRHFELYKGNGDSFEINFELDAILNFSNHLLDSILESINEVDKELVLDFDEKSIEKLEHTLDKLKEQRKALKEKIDKIGTDKKVPIE